MRSDSKRLRLVLLLSVGALLTAFWVAAYATDLLRRPELDTVDSRFAIRGDLKTPDDVVFVAIDDATFNDLKLRWPFRRSVHARAIDNISRAGAKAIGYDVQFTEPSADPRQDNALIEAVGRAGNLVLATTEVGKGGTSEVLGGDAVLRQFHARAGAALLPNDPGGVIRRMPYSVDGLDSLAIGTAEVANRRPVKRSSLGGKDAWIDYVGPPGRIKTISFSRVLRGRYPKNLFRDKIVVVGPAAPSLQDVHPTSASGDDLMSGGEIQANAISTVLDDFPLDAMPGGINVLLIVLLGMTGPAAAIRLRPLRALGVDLLVLVGFVVAVQLAFNSGLIVAFIYPLGALVLGSVGALAVQLITEAVERQRTRDLFARFVPETVVDQVLEQAGGEVRLGGERVTATILFSDLRGFTTFSETKSPDRVIEVLNRYLTEMSDVIMDNGGTLVSYMGDGIMAAFGAPIAQPDHADRALAAAREMVGSHLERFNEWMRSDGLGEGFRMGVGLNSGPIMSGNVGSERRLEYTAIGDTTNTAARLEGMTKGTPHMVFVADSTREMLTRDVSDLQHVGQFEVRGRQTKIDIWSIGEDAGEEPPQAQGDPPGG